MAKFKVTVEGANYAVEAPDENTAWEWANITHKQTTSQQTISPSPQPASPVSKIWQDMQSHGLPNPMSPQGRGGAVMQNASREAVAAIPDMFLNAPTNLYNLGKAGFGTAATALGRSDLAPELTPTPDIVRGQFQKRGWISPENEPQTQGEQYLAAGTGGATGGALAGLPGMFMGAVSNMAGKRVSDVTESPIAGLVASLAVPTAANKVSSSALARELKRSTSPLAETTREVLGAGYKVPPSMMNPTAINKGLESIGGKQAMQQDASIGNQAITDSLIRKELGMSPGTGITEDSLRELASTKAGPYRDVESLAGVPPKVIGSQIPEGAGEWGTPTQMFGKTPKAPEQLVQEWRSTNLRAKQYWNEFSKSGKVEAFDSYTALKEKAGQLERDMEAAAQNANRPEMIAALRSAKTDIAKIHDVDRALNTDRGEVSAIDLARAKDKGVPLTGKLLTAAKMGNTFPKAVQRPETVGSPGVNNLNTMIGGGTGGVLGALLGGGSGAGAGAIGGMLATPYVQSLVRKLLLSKPYQNTIGTPNVIGRTASKIPMTSPDDALLRAYILSQQQGL